MTEWEKGNKPHCSGLYWVTANEAGNIKMYDDPMRYADGTWTLNGRGYFTENIIAFMHCNKPKEPYNERHIGYPDQHYIRVKCNGITHYFSKGLQSIKWSKIGYTTKEKATAVSKRLRKIEPGYQNQKTEITIVNGNGEEHEVLHNQT